MNNKSSKIEILAPCGSYDILIAAVHAGADACYIGGNCFGARAYAENFDEDTIKKAVNYAHLHGVKVYLTVNTLLKQTELSELYDYIKPFYEIGGDALIIQDLGVFSYVRKQFPDIAIHCSTQMNITSRYGAELMKKQGAARVVTAREMSLSEIHEIKEHVDIEVETFVHGAMCYSYSGQCLMSSLAGGRSGNRGRCAQPCRKCYDTSYLLSMKDMCTLSKIPALIEAGIDSLKIEGRMKNAYYVASAVHAYRTLTDDYYRGEFNLKKADALAFELANIYNRGGFSDGYFFRHNGSEMISKLRPNNQGVAIGTFDHIEKGTITIKLTEQVYPQDVLELSTKEGEAVEITIPKGASAGQNLTVNCPRTKQLLPSQTIYRTKCPTILQHVQADYIDRYEKIPVSFTLTAHVNEPLTVTVSCTRQTYITKASISAQIVEASRKQTASPDMIQRPFAQLGATDYYLESFRCDVDPDAFLPNGVLKSLRRDVLAKLEETILEQTYRTAPDRQTWENLYQIDMRRNIYPDTYAERTVLGVTTFEQFEAVQQFLSERHISADIVTAPLEIYERCLRKAQSEITVYPELPHVIHGDFSLDLQESEIRGIYIRNIDGLAYISKLQLPKQCEILCDASLYCYNRLAHAFLRTLVKQPVTFLMPRELKLSELSDLAEEALCLTLYEYQPVMLAANCIQKTKHGCHKGDRVLPIRDELGNHFFARTYCSDCYNVIYNKLPYSILDKYKEPVFADLHARGYMLRFTIEDGIQTAKILQAVSKGVSDISEKTGGHLYRGVL